MDLYLTQLPTTIATDMDTEPADAHNLSSLAITVTKPIETTVAPVDQTMEILSPPRLKSTHDADAPVSPGIAKPTSVSTEPASSATAEVISPPPIVPRSTTAPENTSPADDSSASISKLAPTKKLKGWAKAKAKARATQANLGVSDSSARSTNSTPNPGRKPTEIAHVLRVETRWAPKDYTELCASRDTMYKRLAPIRSCFNNAHTWMMEWQTEQMADCHDIPASSLAKYLSIRIVPVPKQKCF